MFKESILFLFLVLALSGCKPDNNSEMYSEIQEIVTNSVNSDYSIKSCVVSVLNGDGSISWTGAAGMAYSDEQKSMAGDTPFYIASVTKLYTATVIMQLYEDGLISLDDPAAKFLSKEIIYNSDKITVRHLLAHTSGLPDYYAGKGSDGKSFFDIFVEDPDRKWSVMDTINRSKNFQSPVSAPGESVIYSDTNYQLLGLIIESVTNKRLHDVYNDRIFSPLNLKNTWLVNYSTYSTGCVSSLYYNNVDISRVRTNGTYWADGGIVSTAEDCISFLKALNNGKLITSDSLKSMHVWNSLNPHIKYGFGTMLVNLPSSFYVPVIWGHTGSSGSFLYYYPDKDIYIAGTINLTDEKLKAFKLIGMILKVIRSV